MTITDALIEFSSKPVEADALKMMRLSLFDWAACGIAGARDGGFAAFRNAVLAQSGDGPALVLGGGTSTVPQAALINGTLSHALDFDDTHFAHIGHPSVAVIPAVLALAQTQGATLPALVRAALIGAEASVHVGLWLGRGHYQIGFHQTATAGAFGATLGAAVILELDDVRMRHALGLCATMASGLKSQFGTAGKPLNAGLAARNGVEAATWAGCGLTSTPDGLAGALGFGDTHAGENDVSYLADTGSGPCHMLSISHKFHACCHGLHAMLEAIGKTNVGAEDIESIDIATNPRWMTVCNQEAPTTGLGVKFSYKHTAAMALLGISTAAMRNFSDDIAKDAAIIGLRDKVRVTADDSLSETQASVRITLKNGRAEVQHHDLSAPITMDERRVRLREKALVLLGSERANRLWHAVQGNDIRDFVATLEA